eukprot:6213631-Pleurochrysis_carterae.AAC.1
MNATSTRHAAMGVPAVSAETDCFAASGAAATLAGRLLLALWMKGREKATVAVLPVTTLKRYLQNLKSGTLTAPCRNAKTKGFGRMVAEVVRSAQVLRKHGSELRSRFKQGYGAADFASPSLRRSLSKELHAAELEQRDAEHDLKLSVLQTTLNELDGVVATA